MRVLITAGSTEVPIDKVRVISNIFGGRTGAELARFFARRKDEVTLLTSNPRLLRRSKRISVKRFRTYDDLAMLMEREVCEGGYDVVIHSAAVSDFTVVAVRGTQAGMEVAYQPADAGKIPSTVRNLALVLAPTPKLIDKIRAEWQFGGVLVKFKLEVGMTDEGLIAKATRSMHDSHADLIVANCLEWASLRAFIISHGSKSVSRVGRRALPVTLRRIIKGLITKRGVA